MKHDFHSIRKRPISFPVLIICILLFLMYAIIDTAIVYDSISPLAALLCCAVCLGTILSIIRFSFVKYDYKIVGDELVIRRYTLRTIDLVSALHISEIRSIERKRLFFRRAHRAKKYNLTNSLYATLFSALLMTYFDPSTAKTTCVLISPPNDVQRILRMALEDRYRIPTKE